MVGVAAVGGDDDGAGAVVEVEEEDRAFATRDASGCPEAEGGRALHAAAHEAEDGLLDAGEGFDQSGSHGWSLAGLFWARRGRRGVVLRGKEKTSVDGRVGGLQGVVVFFGGFFLLKEGGPRLRGGDFG